MSEPERESMEVDVLYVGAGPANLASAYHLMKQVEAHNARAEAEGGTPIEVAIADRCGFDIVGPGQLRFEKDPYVANSFGTVNGGVMAFAAEAAAVSAAGGGDALDLQIHYLEQVGDGPVGVTAEIVRDAGDGDTVLADVRLEDRADRRLVAVATVGIRLD